jgi:hypothetical protein
MSIGNLDTGTVSDGKVVSLPRALQGRASHKNQPKPAVSIQNSETQDYRAARWGAVLVSPPIIPFLSNLRPDNDQDCVPLAARSLMPSCFETY